ncbi:MAG: cache domain-containing protein, partial [Treponema sp.]|nr:cache domain-containing protein [Treponema sp.]
MKMLSLRIKILAIVLVFPALLGAAFVIYSLSITVNYKKLRLEGIENLTGYETEKVNKIISEIERSAVFYAIGGKITYEAGLETLGETISVDYLTGFPTAVGAGFWYEPYAFKKDQKRAGFYAFYDKAKGHARLDESFFMDFYDYHSMSWYREIAENITQPHQVVWTKPYVDDSGSFSLMITAGCGVFNEDGKLIAISTVDWEIDGIIKQLLNINPTKNSFVLLSVPDKDYIISGAHSNYFTGDSVLNIPWDIFADSFNINGVNYISFGRFMDNGWYLNINIPENEIFNE